MKMKEQKTIQIGKKRDKIGSCFFILEKKLNLIYVKLLRATLAYITRYGIWGRELCP